MRSWKTLVLASAAAAAAVAESNISTNSYLPWLFDALKQVADG
jgi:hypothetical protein